MAYRLVNGNAIDIKKEKGKPYEGEFLSKEVKPIQGKDRTIWHFVGLDSVPFAIWGFTTLDSTMSKIIPGTKCRITYTGMKFMPTKHKPAGQDVHQVLVEVDDGNDEERPPIEDFVPE